MFICVLPPKSTEKQPIKQCYHYWQSSIHHLQQHFLKINHPHLKYDLLVLNPFDLRGISL